ncbi:MAG TPA: hypothetical protein PKA42_02895 [Candidatus Paceibacterota bacterium]|nr:hypothetical protein [Candidatus Paceibacterota bacterium]HMO83093.1 hypothetical protein [Candidatus Paceibacterota bacterium]
MKPSEKIPRLSQNQKDLLSLTQQSLLIKHIFEERGINTGRGSLMEIAEKLVKNLNERVDVSSIRSQLEVALNLKKLEDVVTEMSKICGTKDIDVSVVEAVAKNIPSVKETIGAEVNSSDSTPVDENLLNFPIKEVEDEIEVLAELFRKNFNRDPYRENPFRRVKNALSKIKQNHEVDPKVRVSKNRLYAKNLVKTIQEIKDFYKSKNIRLFNDLNRVEADQTVEVRNTPHSQETKNIKTTKDNLIKRYIDLDSTVFNAAPGLGRKFKDIPTIKSDITYVLECSGFDGDQIKIFINDVVNKIINQIVALNVAKGKEEAKEVKAELNQKIQAEYHSLLTAVSNILNKDRQVSVANSTVPDNLPIMDIGVADKELSGPDTSQNFGLPNPPEVSDIVTARLFSGELSPTELQMALAGGSGPEESDDERRGWPMTEKEWHTKQEEDEQCLENERVDRLYNLYKNADESVFKQNPSDPNSSFKPFPDIRKDIRDVLERAGVDEEEIDQFEDKKVTGYYHGEITLALKIKKDGKSKAQFAADLPALKAEAQEKVSKIYKELIKKVKEMIEEAESKAGVDSKAPNPDKEPGKEKLEQFIKSCTTFDELYALLDKLGQITGSSDVPYSFGQLKTEIETIRGEVIKLIKSHPGGDINTLIEVVFTAQGNRITSTGGLREQVKRLVKQEYGLDKIEKTDPAPDSGVKDISLDGYRAARKNLFEAKNKLIAKEEEYQKALEARGFISKIRGVEDEALQALKVESDDLRTAYAKALDTALQAKSDKKRTKSVRDVDGKVIGTEETDDESIFTKPKFKYETIADDKVKLHFLNKLKITDKIKNVKLLEESQSPEKQRLAESVLAFLKKNRWPLRIGTVLLGGAVAMGTGGVATALGFKAFKMGKAGLAAAAFANVATNKWVTQSEDTLKQTVKKFTLDNINSVEDELIKADKGLTSAKRRQAAATVGAGIVGGFGFAAGTEAANALGFGGTEVTPPSGVAAVFEDGGSKVAASVPTQESDALFQDNFEDKVSDLEAGVSSPEISKESSPYVCFRADGAEINIVNNISFSGENISDQNLERVHSYIKVQVNNAYADSAHFNVDTLENNLPARLAERFGGESWWPEGGIKVDLQVEQLAKMGVPETVSVPVDVTAGSMEMSGGNANDVINDTELNTTPEPVNENIYTVQRGDTLSDIINTHFAEELRQAPPGQYNQVLYQVLDNIEKNRELRESLGMKSNDIDLIYPNEKLDLTAVGEELKKVLTERQAIVDGPDLSEVATPESLIASESVVEAPSFSADAKDPNWRPYEPIPEQQVGAGGQSEILAPLKIAPVEGQYFNQPAWSEYVNQHFGSEAAFNRVLTAEIAKIDNLQSDWFSRFLGGEDYESPYRLMSNMTMNEINALREHPDFDVRAYCQEKNLKYETYLDWQNKITELSVNYRHVGDTTLSDLFKRYVADVKAPNINRVTT